MKMDSPTIQIRDLGLAAALVSCAYEMRGTTRDTGGQTYFMFTKTDELERAVNSYWADTLAVKARKYSDNIKMLKSRIYGER
jgi:succinate dehydrogenase/fumarate reductase flavoprotein subunit